MASAQRPSFVERGPMSAFSQAYPRPDFRRIDLAWESLHGLWDFLFDDADIGLQECWHKTGLPAHVPTPGDAKPAAKRMIYVPFVFQAAASGIHELGAHEVLWYERTIEDLRNNEHARTSQRLLVRFGAVDYYATVWLDGQCVGEHRGGHVPFELDLTEAVQSSSSTSLYRLTVRVFDSATDKTQPRGKQFWGPKPEHIWYTPSSGIWQNVWLESVPTLRIADSSHGSILRSNEIERGILDARIAVQGRRARQTCSIELEVSLAGVVVNISERRQLPGDEDFVRFDHDMRIDEPRRLPNDFLYDKAPLEDQTCWRNHVALWSPDHPLLYDLTFRLFDEHDKVVDEVRTTTGMRSLDWTTGDGTFRLNGRPLLHSLLLDQGYWPHSLMTPLSSEALKTDIILSKKMGFNGCRKHQKVEDPIFMYWADRLGFLVWGEMASCHHFSMEMVDRFNQEWMEMVRRDINHPCIVCWTPANESWGYPDLGGQVRQRDHLRKIYYMTKALDPTRPINDNCGWMHVLTDLSTFHEYGDANHMRGRCSTLPSILTQGFPMFLGPIYSPSGAIADEGSKHQRGAPVMCTEFGGVNVAGGQGGDWGYTTAAHGQDLLKKIEEQIMAVLDGGHVCALVWTQFSDIEREVNGLYTEDRREKVPAEEMRGMIKRAENRYLSRLMHR